MDVCFIVVDIVVLMALTHTSALFLLRLSASPHIHVKRKMRTTIKRCFSANYCTRDSDSRSHTVECLHLPMKTAKAHAHTVTTSAPSTAISPFFIHWTQTGDVSDEESLVSPPSSTQRKSPPNTKNKRERFMFCISSHIFWFSQSTPNPFSFPPPQQKVSWCFYSLPSTQKQSDGFTFFEKLLLEIAFW